MPGVVVSAAGLPDKSGRKASLHVTDADLADMSKLEKMTKTKGRRIVCGTSTATDDEIKAFRAEVEKAKAATKNPAPRASVPAAKPPGGDAGDSK